MYIYTKCFAFTSNLGEDSPLSQILKCLLTCELWPLNTTFQNRPEKCERVFMQMTK